MDGTSESNLWTNRAVLTLLAGILVVVIPSSIFAGWTLARTYTSDRLEALQQSNDWKLPETLTLLKEASESANVNLIERNELVELRKRDATAKELIRELESRSAAAEMKLAEIEKQLFRYEGESFTLSEGQSRFILPRVLAIAVHSCGRNFCEVQLGPESKRLNIAEPISVEHDGKRVVVTLIDINSAGESSYPYEAVFSISQPQEYKVSP